MKEYPRKYMQDFTCFLKRNYLEISFFQDEFYARKTWCQSKYEFHVKSESHTTPKRKIINTELERYECNFNNRQPPRRYENSDVQSYTNLLINKQNASAKSDNKGGDSSQGSKAWLMQPEQSNIDYVNVKAERTVSGLSIYLGWDAYLWKNDKLECSKLRNLNGVYNILSAKLPSRRNIESTTQICRQLNQYLTVQSTQNTPTHTQQQNHASSLKLSYSCLRDASHTGTTQSMPPQYREFKLY